MKGSVPPGEWNLLFFVTVRSEGDFVRERIPEDLFGARGTGTVCSPGPCAEPSALGSASVLLVGTGEPSGRTLLVWKRRVGPGRLKGVIQATLIYYRWGHCQDCPS